MISKVKWCAVWLHIKLMPLNQTCQEYENKQNQFELLSACVRKLNYEQGLNFSHVAIKIGSIAHGRNRTEFNELSKNSLWRHWTGSPCLMQFLLWTRLPVFVLLSNWKLIFMLANLFFGSLNDCWWTHIVNSLVFR